MDKILYDPLIWTSSGWFILSILPMLGKTEKRLCRIAGMAGILFALIDYKFNI